jgi:Holliday junction DNA helicase RuvB
MSFVKYCRVCGKMLLGVKDNKCSKCVDIVYTTPSNKTVEIKQVNNWNTLVTPKTLDEFTGQEKIKKELKIILESHNKTGIPVSNILFSGSYGSGKTTLAKIFSSMLGEYKFLNGDTLKSLEGISGLILIDEIHALKTEEFLLSEMDAGRVTVIGATTSSGTLSGALRSRFINFVLEPYGIPDLVSIIKNASSNINFKCPEDIAVEIASRSKLNARISLQLFKRVYDRLITGYSISWKEDFNIDNDGLDSTDHRYLSYLSDKPVGLQTICSLMGLDRVTVEETIEPYLLLKGYMIRTPRGRIINKNRGI